MRAGQDSGYFFARSDHERADLLRRRRHRRGQHELLRRPVALQLRRRRAGGHSGAGGRPGSDHRGDDPGARLRARQGRDPGGRSGQQPRGHGEPARRRVTSPVTAKDPHSRTINNDSCYDLPVEGPHVPRHGRPSGRSGKKSDFSNYSTEPASGEIEFSAPGGWFRDGFGTETYRAEREHDPLVGPAGRASRTTG